MKPIPAGVAARSSQEPRFGAIAQPSKEDEQAGDPADQDDSKEDPAGRGKRASACEDGGRKDEDGEQHEEER